ncbi:MAG: metal-dependent transcriptional regulator [Candidatus Pacebacteria bacterium]|jgi:DtxR family Mn-dependent transcriptional regulator|nr:metal-dependent transcriptional regulator [Candidatus Paceibacterota bacterium]
MPKQSQEDYLRAIYSLFEKSGDEGVSSVDIATEMKISKAAVSKMLKKLDEAHLIKMTPYSSFKFLAKGKREAEKVIYKRRIVEVFLLEVLKVDRDKISAEAHALEHSFSDDSIKRLAKLLGDPEVCPCGNKIPKIK